MILGSVGCGMEEDPDTVGTEVPGMTEDSETPTLQAPEPRNCVFIVQRGNGRVLSYSASSEQVSTSALSLFNMTDTRFHWCMGIPGPTNLNRSRFYPRNFQNSKELDAYETADHDYNVVLRPIAGSEPSHVWRVNQEVSIPLFPPIPSNVFRISQLNTERYLDAYDVSPWRAVTRDFQYNDTQRWVFKPVAGCTCDPI